MNELPFTVALVALEIAYSALLLVTLRAGGARMMSTIAVVLVVWLSADYLLLRNGWFSSTGFPQLSFVGVLTLLIILGFVATRAWTPLRNVVTALTTRDFLRLQTPRVIFGGMFFATTALPLWIKSIGGVGDIIAGGSALLALRLLRARPSSERSAILLGNLPGVADFVVILSLGALVLFRHQSPDIPFDLVPLYVVPILILLHVYSLARLRSISHGHSTTPIGSSPLPIRDPQ
jgi:hypothetical protein